MAEAERTPGRRTENDNSLGETKRVAREELTAILQQIDAQEQNLRLWFGELGPKIDTFGEDKPNPRDEALVNAKFIDEVIKGCPAFREYLYRANKTVRIKPFSLVEIPHFQIQILPFRNHHQLREERTRGYLIYWPGTSEDLALPPTQPTLELLEVLYREQDQIHKKAIDHLAKQTKQKLLQTMLSYL